MTKDEMKNRISMALKDPVLQQGFEIICKDLAISEHDREHNDYELTEVYKKVEQLEKENSQLKEANQILATMNESMWVELEKKRAESQGITNKLHQLIKAKEIIKELLDTQSQLDPYRDIFKDRILKAEQFLSEE